MVCTYNQDMIFDVCNLIDKIGASLLLIYTYPVGQI